MFGNVYRGRRVLLTGHTGFKGSWLALWLRDLGAEVVGMALPPEGEASHWSLLNLPIDNRIVDIRDSAAVTAIVREVAPEIVFHLAAQSLVRCSYREPAATWSSNVLGSVHLLEACRQSSSVRGILLVTSDKCYEPATPPIAHVETDRLGGLDPYSASKAAVELVAASYRSSYFGRDGSPLVATARAGNVIGGGDWAADRLIPDLVRARAAGQLLEVRYPSAVRPWQHVLESLSGYLVLGQRLLEGAPDVATAWNFGPNRESAATVGDVLGRIRARWPGLEWQVPAREAPHETNTLMLDSARAKERLQWAPVWSLDVALDATVEWYREHAATGRILTLPQLARYVGDARIQGASWAGL
jgi:CDP-glucose 4,6-dehydratase